MVAIYVGVFNATYRDLVAPTFEGWGLGSRPIPALNFWISSVLCVLPASWIPLEFKRPSLLLFYAQYFLMFIPASFIVYSSVRPEISSDAGLLLVCLMFVGLSVIQASYLFPTIRLTAFRLTPEAFWLLFCLAFVLMMGYLVVTLAGNFRLVSFEDVYTVRAAMSQTLQATGSRFGLYAQALISAVFLPIIFATGMWLKRRWVILPVVIGYTFLFGIGGAKGAALAIIFLPLVYALLSRPQSVVAPTLLLSLVGLLLVGYVVGHIASAQVAKLYIAVVHFRFLTVPPLTIPQYYDFFQNHPVTHLSHVSGLNVLLQYPYETDIPYTLGTYFYHVPVGANSGFWAGDGIAGFGVGGIVLMSVVCALVFWLLDTCSAEFNPRFVGSTLSYCIVFFGNVPLFTTLVTGGLGFLMLAMLIAPRSEQGIVRFPSLANLRQSAESVGH